MGKEKNPISLSLRLIQVYYLKAISTPLIPSYHCPSNSTTAPV